MEEVPAGEVLCDQDGVELAAVHGDQADHLAGAVEAGQDLRLPPGRGPPRPRLEILGGQQDARPALPPRSHAEHRAEGAARDLVLLLVLDTQ